MASRLEQTGRQIAILSGLVLFAFAGAELCADAIGLVSLQTMGNVDAWQLAFTRSLPGLALLSLACVSHVVTTLWLTARRATLRMSFGDMVQVSSGILIPLLLLPYLVDTRVANISFSVNDDTLYRLAKLWPEHNLLYVALIIVLWVHGCVGLNQWLKLRPSYPRIAPILSVIALAVPIAAVSGLIASARIVSVLMTEPSFAEQIRAATHWPSAEVEHRLERFELIALASYGAVLVVLVGALTARFMKILVAPKIDVVYVNGPKLKASTGPTLLEISLIHAVPHAHICGGRGRCTACSVRIEEGGTALPPPNAAERELLGTGDDQIRLACQIKPRASLTVTRLTATADAASAPEPEVDTAGVERQAAALCVRLRGHAALIGSRRAYDAIFFLNEFLDAINGAILKHQGVVMRTTESGLVVLFGQEEAAPTACRAAIAAVADIDIALGRLNERFAAEFGQPIAVVAGVAFGTAYLGRVGAGPSKAFTAIGPVVDRADFLATLAEGRGHHILLDPATLQAAAIEADGMDRISFTAFDGTAQEALALNAVQLRTMAQAPA